MSSETISQDQETGVTPKFFITQNEIADVFGVSPQAISMFAKQKGCETFKVGSRTAYPPSSARKLFESKGVKYPETCQVIAFQCLKGGSTKTSSLFNLAVRLASYGARVLCVDLDGQGNLTDSFSFDVIDQPVFYHVANNEVTAKEAIVSVSEYIDLIPSDLDNAVLEGTLAVATSINLRTYVRSKLDPVLGNYDFCLIDCNPSLSKINNSIALGADSVIIPANPDKYSFKGVQKTIEEYKNLFDAFGKEIKYKILYTLFDNREGISQKYLLEYGKKYEGKMIPVAVRRSADIKNAIDAKKSIFEYPKALAREDYDAVAMNMLGINFKNEADKGL